MQRLRSRRSSLGLRGNTLPPATRICQVIGTGSFAKVRVARHKLTGQHVAIKTYEKSKMKDPVCAVGGRML